MFYTDAFMQDVMGIQELPVVLYHYTSIDTLALILSSRTLRFTRLDGVNDPEEATASDLPDASSLVFASCWTAQERESLAMWRIYTPDMQGVRVALPNNPFLGRHSPVVFEKGGALQLIDTLITISRSNGGGEMNTRAISGPNKVYYTDDPIYRNRNCLSREEEGWSFQLYDLGMVKNTYWAFEEEWRYRILAAPSEATFEFSGFASHPTIDLKRYPIDEVALYVPLSAECVQTIEVLLGPCVTEAQVCIVRALLDFYAPAAKLHQSEIKVRFSK